MRFAAALRANFPPPPFQSNRAPTPAMSGSAFRHRELNCHASDSETNDRASYKARRIAELDALSAVGAVVNVSKDGHGVARFVHCQRTRVTWLRAAERALVTRYLTRLLRVSPSVEAASRHLSHDRFHETSTVNDDVDAYVVLVTYTVMALVRRRLQEKKEPLEVISTLPCLVGALYTAKHQALPLLTDWLLFDTRGAENDDTGSAAFWGLVLADGPHEKTLERLNDLRSSVRRDVAATRDFMTHFLLSLGEQSSHPGTPMATHIPESFLCDDEDKRSSCRVSISVQDEVDELWKTFVAARDAKDGPASGALCDLIDPSLNCRVDNHCNGSDKKSGLGSRASTKVQWLATDFQVAADASVTALSPLHGSLHFHHFPGLYALVPKLLGRVVPLFERVLTSLATERPPLPHHIGLGSLFSSRSKQQEASAARFSAPPLSEECFSLRGRQIQVITKLSSVRLGTVHPTFAGEPRSEHYNDGWQRDGDAHEHIVAVAYHVLCSRNVTAPQLSFRAFAHAGTATDESAMLSTQEDAFLAFGERTSGYFGGKYGRLFLQPWGALTLHEHRSMALPSTLAHRLEPFELLDATDPQGGELSLLTLYLVDPSRPTAVTAPCQRRQSRRFVEANVGMLRAQLPEELARHVTDFAACSASEAQARVDRLQLLAGRRKRQELRFLAPTLRLQALHVELPGS